MTLTIEDGTQVDGALSYISATDADTFHTARGNAAWTGTDAVKEAALIKACVYLDGHYRARWKGQKVAPISQPMEWPRVGVKVIDGGQIYYDVPASFYDSEYSGYIGITTIPQRVKDAACELALRALSGELAADGDASIGRKKIDVIDTEYRNGVLKGSMA
ncbi:MAG: hypothetical protein PF442_08330, partial [Desulfobulbaceae bacterium]|nr:hypothetical protein [Desulfobulbaceae bacterium]